jgi:pimeloyl-ACP methyl ester carboxylesterase
MTESAKSNPGDAVVAGVERSLSLARTWLAWDGRPRMTADGERLYTPHKAIRRHTHHLVDHLAEIEAPLELARVAAVGHSAGGHLVLWVAGRADARVPLAAVVGQAAVSDLEAAAAQGVCGGMVERLLGGSADRVPDRYREASPMRRLPLTVPALLVHGDRDGTVPVAMSRAFAAAAGCELAELAGDGHFEHIEPGTRAWATVTAWLERH